MYRLIIFCLVLTILSCQSSSTKTAPAPVAKTTTAEPKQSSVLKYKIRPSLNENNAPLLILLHGYGDNADNFSRVGEYFDPRLTVASIYAPQDFGNNRFGWYTIDFSTPELKGNFAEAVTARQQIIATIEAILTETKGDAERVYLLGFSQGTIMSLNIALAMPEKVKGAILFSGKLMPDLVAEIVEKSRLKNLQLFLTHGTKDEVLKIKEGRIIHEQLKELAIPDLTYSEFAGPHTIPPQQLQLAMQWLTDRLDK